MNIVALVEVDVIEVTGVVQVFFASDIGRDSWSSFVRTFVSSPGLSLEEGDGSPASDVQHFPLT